MATYYVNPADTGSNLGTQADPYVDLMSAVGVAVDGDTILCQGTQTLVSGGTDKISFSGLTGTAANGGIKITGVNSSWGDDGTIFTLDGNNANATDGLGLDGCAFLTLSNFDITQCQGHGVTTTAVYCDSNVLRNVRSGNNTGSGFYNLLYVRHSLFERCFAELNSGYGFYKSFQKNVYFCCVSKFNSLDGFYLPTGLYLSSISARNGSEGFGYCTAVYAAFLVNCVIDDNGSHGVDGYYNQNAVVAILNRITNNGGFGIRNTDTVDAFTQLYNFINSNTSGDTPSGYWFGNTGTLTTGTIGYVNQPNGDYNLTDTATMRDVPITLPG